MHILMIFLDGVGLGDDDDPAANPFLTAELPTLHKLTNGHRWLKSTIRQETAHSVWIPTNPRMNVAGRPQSATGQAAILTGRNIPQLIGEHYGPKPNEAIRDLLDEDNLFRRVISSGKTAALLEAYPPAWHDGINRGKSLPSSYQYAAQSAGIRFLDIDDLRAGNAVSGDWTGEAWHSRMGFDDVPILSAYDAGVRLVELARRVDFAFFPHWITDVVGHRGALDEAANLLEQFDAVMAGVLDCWQDDEGFVIVTSDHGNMEAIGNRKHTENDVPTLVIGDDSAAFADGIQTLADIAPRIVRWLGI